MGDPFRTFKLTALDTLNGSTRSMIGSRREYLAADVAAATIALLCVVALLIAGVYHVFIERDIWFH